MNVLQPQSDADTGPGYPLVGTSTVGSTKYLESLSWSMIMIVITNLFMSIVKRAPSGFRITVKQPIATVR